MVRIGCPDDVTRYYMTDDPDIIFKLHQTNCQPMWIDEGCIYFKKNSKLKKVLAKIGVDMEEAEL